MSICVKPYTPLLSSNTQIITDNVADCATASGPHYVLLTPQEYSTLSQSPLNLSVADGLTISGAIFSVWAIAWGFRALFRTLSTDGEALE